MSTINSSLRLAVTLVAVAAATAVYGAVVLPDPTAQDLLEAYLGPGRAGHLLGTDALGRDIFSGIAASIATAALVGLSVVLISAIIGVTVGLVSGYRGGWLDAVLMRAVDLQLSIPPLLLFVSMVAVLGHSLPAMIALLCLPSWVPYARVVRGKVLADRQRPSVTAARLAGATRLRVMTRHLLPASLPSVLVLGSLQLGWVLLWESALSFVNLGVQPPTASFGQLIAAGRQDLQSAWWVVVFPGLTLALLVLAANLLGDGLGKLLDVDARLIER
ncbi:ABC transporter permease [Dactylosporangium sucinum]|uniref:Peptide ABC transporter permease n=1 Tax=Dactylosporangium sucinum TaxID=1424081 RepID=A0A917X5X6_9ACTN|nr:ABC transporter permease [Dactylosporangium sucinum]GGM69760.1 peptide ABC transporter permease [Dactylosporangium sucinum]